jgi:hypothetical protein
MRSQLLYQELDKTLFPVERQFHVLKHFKSVDKEYFMNLQDNSGYTTDEITHQLDVRGSDFYDGFALNPMVLWQKLKSKIPHDNIKTYWINDKCEIEVEYNQNEYPDGIGEDHLAHISELPQGILDMIDRNDWKSLRKLTYRAKPKPTWTVQIILRKLGDSPEVISIFPGIYAPQLPDQDIQSEEDYARSLEFWKTHVVLKI